MRGLVLAEGGCDADWWENRKVVCIRYLLQCAGGVVSKCFPLINTLCIPYLLLYNKLLPHLAAENNNKHLLSHRVELGIQSSLTGWVRLRVSPEVAGSIPVLGVYGRQLIMFLSHI